jgi:AbrB family looped-hinge helix DNA binding protein
MSAIEARMTSKGQVTIPKSLREFLGLRPGHRVRFERTADGQVVVLPRRADRRRVSLDHLVGIAQGKWTTDEIMRMTRGDDWSSAGAGSR